jgi:hypothetical protein
MSNVKESHAVYGGKMIEFTPKIALKKRLLLSKMVKLTSVIKSISPKNGINAGFDVLHTIKNDLKNRAIFPINRTKPAQWLKNGPSKSKVVFNSGHSTNVKECLERKGRNGEE